MGVRVLAGIANSEEHPASARVAAVTALFDRGWGRPDQPVQVIDRRDVPVEELSDADLHLIASRALPRTDQPPALLMPPTPKDET